MQHTIEIQFCEEQWQCFRTLCQMPEGTSRATSYITRQLGETPRKIRRILAELVQKGYIAEKSYEVTDLGRSVYQEHFAWWKALVWRLREWDLPKEKVWLMADHMLCSTDADFVRELIEQYEYAQMRDIPEAVGAIIDDTDLSARIPEGIYHIGFCLLDEDSGDNLPFMSISPWQESFQRMAKLVVKARESHLELAWNNEHIRLEGITYWAGLRELFQKKDRSTGQVALPLTSLSFEHVPLYRLMKGEMKIILHIRKADGAGQTEKYPLLLKLSLLW